MKSHLTFAATVLLMLLITAPSKAQNEEINTVFNGGGLQHSGGYGAITNKFTTIDGKFANIVEVYGGWYLNRKFMIGAGGSATTNRINVPEAFSAIEGEEMNYEYGQCGLVTEYVLGSNRTIHLVFHLFTGAGFTMQYIRDNNYYGRDNYEDNYVSDVNWFMVAEPGIQAEINLLKWMRFSPGVSYRATYKSDGLGLSDDALSGPSVNATFKFGKF